MTSEWTEYVGAEMYSELGRALAQWQHVEIGLYHVFTSITQIPNSLIASAVFFSPINFKDKLTMVDSAAQFALADSPYLEAWSKLHNKIHRRNRRRNEIAHFMALHRIDDEDHHSLLRPNMFDAKYALYWSKKGKLPEYTPKQLREISQSFGRLSQSLEDFARQLHNLDTASLDKSPL